MASYRQVSEPASAARRLLAPETYENQRLWHRRRQCRGIACPSLPISRGLQGKSDQLDGIIGLPTGVEVVAEPAVEPHSQTTPPRLPISRILTGHGAPRAAHRSWHRGTIFLGDPRPRVLVWSTHWHAKDTPANWIALEGALPASS
jgi:hypothetical protein